MPAHEYSKLTTDIDGDQSCPEVNEVAETPCFDCRRSSRYRILKFALMISTSMLALALIALTIILSRIPLSTLLQFIDSSSNTPDTYLPMNLGRDSRYMTRNHTADALWDVMLEDHLGEYATLDGAFDRGEFSM